MTQFSGMWTTSGGPSGHQQASYTQAQLSTAFEILAACANFEGVAPNLLNKLAPSDGGSETANIATGSAMVDGKFYENDAVEGINVIAAVGGGNTRIDRIVLRADWSGFKVELFLIGGTDAGSPSVPSITQSSGTTYDLMICQVLVDTSGNITITDERIWASPLPDDSSIEINSSGQVSIKALGVDTAELAADSISLAKMQDDSVDTAELVNNAVSTTKIANGAITEAKIDSNSVDDTKIGNRVPMLTRRQGGNSSDWSIQGTTDYTPTAIKIQVGADETAGSVAQGNSEARAVTFPQAFSNKPIVLLTVIDQGILIYLQAVSATGFTAVLDNQHGGTQQLEFNWEAIGPE